MNGLELLGGGECELTGDRTLILPKTIVMLTPEEIDASSQDGVAIAAGIYEGEAVWVSRSGALYTLGPISDHVTLQPDGYNLHVGESIVDLRTVQRRRFT